MKRKIRFIINPRSGIHSGGELPKLISALIDKNTFDVDIAHTQHAGHGEELSADAVKKNYFAVVAVGGDGSVQEAARAIAGTATLLGIIPKGSGNGFARHLGIPIRVKDALEIINRSNSKAVDVLRVNRRICINVFGIGFDGHIANLFSKMPVRGQATYVKLVLKRFSRFKPVELQLTADGKQHHLKSFLITFANGSQFGNNAAIAPQADVGDGLMDVCSIKKFPFAAAPSLIYLLMKKLLDRSRYYSMFRAKEVIIHPEYPIEGHLDGEPVVLDGEVRVEVVSKCLHVIVP
jgi:YegS/Rv2252/BmrU family lipid kinase